MTNLKLYFYIGLAALIVAGSVWAYGIYKDYQALKIAHSMTLQNKKALEDSLTVQFGKVTILTSQVRDLKSENQDLKGKNVALQIKNKILLDSLHGQGQGAATVTDSTAYVPFEGKQKFANYKGWTLANTITKKSEWDINLWFDIIDTRSVLFQDTDGLWKVKTESLTDGAQVKGISTIDDDTFAALQKYDPPTPPKNFGLNIQASTTDFWGGIVFRFDDRWYMNLNYRIINNQPKWIDNTLVGVSYFAF